MEAILFVEALYFSNSYFSKGIQTRCHRCHSMGEPLTITKRCGIAKMLSQVGSKIMILSSRNICSELLEMQVEDRLLIVISDGEPVGRNAGTLLSKQSKKQKIMLWG